MKIYNQFSILVIILFISSNCAPVTSDMQSAKLTGKGGMELTIDKGSLDYESDENQISEIQDNLGLLFAYGLSEKFDLRGRYESINLNNIDNDGDEITKYSLMRLGLKHEIITNKLALYLPYSIYYNSEGEDGPKTLEPTLIYTKTIKDAYELNPSAKVIIPMDEEMVDDDLGLAFNLGFGLNPGRLLKKVEFEKAVFRAEYGIYFPPGSEGESWYSHTTFGLSYKIK